ncbi:MAG: LPS-assembly protein LptD [Deltaproteobacteria bacterium]|nr:LPS-assembly protein LptD [Deltaproteobacteria bacterium]
MKILYKHLIILTILLISSKYVYGSSFNNKKWHIKADEVISQDISGGEYVLDGNIIISDGEVTIKADFVRFNSVTQKIFARGNISLETKGKDKIEGTSIDYDMKKKIGTIYNGMLFIKNKHFYIRGKKIQKIDEDTYEIDDVSVTSCDDEVPDWKITARKLSVTIEGYGYLTHSMFWVKKVPVIYFPGVVFPAKLKRQSGLLFPYIESSESNGFTYNQPLFLTLGRSSDLTYYNNYMDKKGLMPGVQARYVVDTNSKGTFFYNYLKDKNINSSYTNVEEERYWFRMKQKQELPYGINIYTDIDVVSDQYYLTDFKNDKLTGYDDTNEYFEKNFGTSLDNYNDSERQNSLSIKKNWTKYSLDMKFNWLDNVAVKNTDDSNNSLHQLPYLNLKALKQSLWKTPLYFSLNTRYDNFYREDTDADNRKGHRGDLYFDLSYPGSFGFLNIEPSVGIRYTSWNTNYEDSDYESEERSMIYTGISTSSEIYKVFKWWDTDFKHSIKPDVTISCISNGNESISTSFDSIDTISDQKKVTYSITNTFISKNKTSLDQFSYNQFLWFKLSQSYDYEIEDNEGEEPFSDISFELKINPEKYLTLSYDTTYSVYSDQFNTSNSAITVKDSDLFSINLEYRFTRSTSELLIAGITAKISDSVSLFYNYEKDLYNDDTNELEFGGVYKSQCWEFTLKYLEESDDTKYMFYIQLNGLGTIDHKEKVE